MLSVITTMTRVVQKQRIQIGTLKALGFRDYKIMLHYISYGFVISLIGTIFGLIFGYYGIGKMFIGLEMDFFEVPNGHPVMNSNSYIVSLLTILCVVIISLFTTKKILKEKPAEALRTKIPSVNRNSLNITTKSLFNKMSFSSKWNIRDILRNKMRTIMGVIGITGSCMLIVCSFGMLDSMNYFIKLQFEDLFNFDYKLALKEDINSKQLEELEKKYGNKTSQVLGIEIKNGNKREANNIMVTDAPDYIRFINNKGDIIKIDSDDGVYVTYKLAKTNNYKLGDTIKWHIYGDDTYYESKIVGFNKDPQNQNMTMTRKYLESLNIEYHPDSLYTNSDLKGVKTIDGVDVVQDIESLKEGMSNMLSMMKEMLVLIISIAILLGSIIIYNLGILSFTEKQYQFATLKVLGFKDKQIKNIFVKQNIWIAVVAIILGLPLGYYLTDWLFKTAIEEHYDFGASIKPLTYVISSIGTIVISYIVSKILARKVNKIDMVSSLKGNE
jgi:putative ABC transport system permease protein